MLDTNHQEQATEKISKPFFKNWFVWVIMIAIFPFVLFGLFIVYQFVIEAPKAEKAQAQLEIEFKTIAPLPSATLVKYSASHKTSHALVSADYSTDTNPDDIFKHYDEQLKQHGWKFQSSKGVKDWGNDLGGKSADYCKGDYGAELFYAGQKAHYGWTYGFSVDWKLNDCKANDEGNSIK
jgi:hypothetical protein